MEKWPLCEFDVSTKVLDFWWMMKNFGQLVMHKRFVVKRAHLHNNFKGNEMNDTMINGMLVSE